MQSAPAGNIPTVSSVLYVYLCFAQSSIKDSKLHSAAEKN